MIVTCGGGGGGGVKINFDKTITIFSIPCGNTHSTEGEDRSRRD